MATGDDHGRVENEIEEILARTDNGAATAAPQGAREPLDRELRSIKETVIRMGSMAEAAIRDALDALVTHQPELLILDVHMNGVDGVEMAAVVRQIPRYASLPIIFLSSEPDGLIRDRARLVGADDFLAKPMTPAQMAVEVRIRVLRGRTIARLIDRDGLTGVLNQRRVRTAVEREIRRARRQDRPLSLAIIDVDRFKSVNDTYGHDTGDIVLQHIAHLLHCVCTEEDLVARIGGEEFSMILSHVTPEQALNVAERIRTTIENTPINLPSGPLKVTISIGIAVVDPRDKTTDSVLNEMD